MTSRIVTLNADDAAAVLLIFFAWYYFFTVLFNVLVVAMSPESHKRLKYLSHCNSNKRIASPVPKLLVVGGCTFNNDNNNMILSRKLFP
jgi:hypothetical protein